MPTIQQEQAFKIKTQAIKEHKPIKMGKVMIKAGYSVKASGHPKRLTDSKGWQQLLAKYDDEPIMDGIYKDCTNSNPAIRYKNRELYLKVKDLMPTGKLKIGALREREQITEEKN